MAKNDLFLIDGIIEERIKAQNPSSDVGEVFELFAMEQILKEYDLSREEILSNCIDGKDDGGLDYVSVILRLPIIAATLKQKFMNNPEQYETVFSENTDLKIWPQLGLLGKKTDRFLHKIRSNYSTHSSGVKFYKFIRQPLALLLIA